MLLCSSLSLPDQHAPSTTAHRKGDDPSDAARAFIERHGLAPGIIGPLTAHLLDNLKKAQAKAAAAAAAEAKVRL